MIYINKYLKIFTLLSTLFLFAFTSTGISHASTMSDSGTSLQGKVKVTVTNNETGETTVSYPTPTLTSSVEKKNSIKKANSVNKVESQEVFIPIGNQKSSSSITPLDVTGGTKTGGGITANLYVDYDLGYVSGQQEIRLNKVYGSWTPSNTMYYLTNRHVYGHSGSVWGYSIDKYPTSDSFSYTTGFPYNYYATGQASPRMTSTAVSHVQGMTATYTITVEITYP